VNVPLWEQLSAFAEVPSLSAERIAAALNASPSAAVAVVGPDPEAFGRTIASRLGSRGVAYSVELSDDILPGEAQRPVLGHVRIRQRPEERLPLADASLDLVLWAFAVRTLSHAARMLAETKRVLRPGGRFAVADWARPAQTAGLFGDAGSPSITCENRLASAGFSILGSRLLNSSHFLVVGRRQFTDDVSILGRRLMTV
jgi:SAM-dependent methyltransferase